MVFPRAAPLPSVFPGDEGRSFADAALGLPMGQNIWERGCGEMARKGGRGPPTSSKQRGWLLPMDPDLVLGQGRAEEKDALGPGLSKQQRARRGASGMR